MENGWRPESMRHENMFDGRKGAYGNDASARPTFAAGALCTDVICTSKRCRGDGDKGWAGEQSGLQLQAPKSGFQNRTVSVPNPAPAAYRFHQRQLRLSEI